MVATYAAMKSGLKVNKSGVECCSPICSNLCRDEKRTESIIDGMLPPEEMRSNLCRDEKRTESLSGWQWRVE